MNGKSVSVTMALTALLLLGGCTLLDVDTKRTVAPQNSNNAQLESRLDRIEDKLDALAKENKE